MKFNIDNPFFELMGRLGDIMIVNVLFIICSLPIVTIGASFCAMYGTFFRLMDGIEGSLVKTFLSNFRKCLKRGTKAWALVAVSGLVLIFDIVFLGWVDMAGLWTVVGIAVGCLLFLWAMLAAWLFAVFAEEDCGMKEGVRRAMLLSVRHLPATIVMMVLNSIPFICFALGARYVGLAVPVYLVVGFGLTGYVNAYFLARECGFQKY